PPSPRTNPFARASNVLQRPSGAIIRDLESVIVVSGERIRFTPPASAMRHSPALRLFTARCTATSDDEHAVSTATLGPWSPSTNEIRPAATLCALPDAEYASSAACPPDFRSW